MKLVAWFIGGVLVFDAVLLALLWRSKRTRAPKGRAVRHVQPDEVEGAL